MAASRWQRITSLLANDVLGVPIRPVRIMHASSLFMFAMRGRGTPQRSREFCCRGEGRVGLCATGKTCGNFLEQPTVAVRVVERGQREVAAVFWVRTANPDTAEQVRLVGSRVHVAAAMKGRADLHTTIEQFLARGLDVRDDQIESLGGAGGRRGDIRAENNRSSGSRWRELNHAETIIEGEIGVAPARPSWDTSRLRETQKLPTRHACGSFCVCSRKKLSPCES